MFVIDYNDNKVPAKWVATNLGDYSIYYKNNQVPVKWGAEFLGD